MLPPMETINDHMFLAYFITYAIPYLSQVPCIVLGAQSKGKGKYINFLVVIFM